MADPNLESEASNLAVFLHDTGFYCYCLYDNSKSVFPNSLVVKDENGAVIFPVYNTDTVLEYKVLSLDFNGRYFYSLQSYTSAETRIGSIVSKWELDDDSSVLLRKSFRVFSGNYFFNALANEYYWFELSLPAPQGSKNVFLRLHEDKLGAKRIRAGDLIHIGPNSLGICTKDYVEKVEITPTHIKLTLNSGLISDFGSGTPCLFDRSLYLFDGMEISRIHSLKEGFLR
jgi:hypothetical protein